MILSTSMANPEERALGTLKEMLIDRGYTIRESGGDHYCMDIGRRIICFLCVEDKLNIGELKDKFYVMNKEKVRRCIIVYRESVTPSVLKAIETIQEFYVELFSINELQFNITTHRLVPRHMVATPQEKKELVRYHGKLPLLLYADAIRRYYDFKRGEIIRITRKDGSILYRVVK